MSDSLEPEGYPVHVVGGPNELLSLHPEVMGSLGALSAFWVSTDHVVCRLLGALLNDPGLAHHAFYSIEATRARHDMVLAVAKNSDLAERHLAHVECAINAHRKATTERNSLFHGLLGTDPVTGDLIMYKFKPATKAPLTVTKDLSQQIKKALHYCYRAISLLALSARLIDLVHNQEDRDIGEIQRIESLLDEAQTLESP